MKCYMASRFSPFLFGLQDAKAGNHSDARRDRQSWREMAYKYSSPDPVEAGSSRVAQCVPAGKQRGRVSSCLAKVEFSPPSFGEAL